MRNNWWNKSTKKNDHLGKSGTNGELLVGVLVVFLGIIGLAFLILTKI